MFLLAAVPTLSLMLAPNKNPIFLSLYGNDIISQKFCKMDSISALFFENEMLERRIFGIEQLPHDSTQYSTVFWGVQKNGLVWKMISFLMVSITNFGDVREPYCLPAVSKHLQLWFFFYIYCDCQEKDYSFHILKRGYDKRQQPPATSETILYKCSGKVLGLVRYPN